MAAIWPANGGSRRSPSLACSGGQYSHWNISASPIDWNCPIASASAMTAAAASAMSAATIASALLRPRPNRPSPGTSTIRGRGSSMMRGVP
jgi:hypothetical protein